MRCDNSDLITLMVVLHRTQFSISVTLGIRNQLMILVTLYSSLPQQLHLLAGLTRFSISVGRRRSFRGKRIRRTWRKNHLFSWKCLDRSYSSN